MKILNCPFCASPDINIYHEQHEEDGQTAHYAYCECTRCLAQGPMMIRRFGTEERCKRMAKELWNVRSENQDKYVAATHEVLYCKNCGNGRYLLPKDECPYCERKYGDV